MERMVQSTGKATSESRPTSESRWYESSTRPRRWEEGSENGSSQDGELAGLVATVAGVVVVVLAETRRSTRVTTHHETVEDIEETTSNYSQ